MSDYPKVSNDISSSSVDSLNTNSCSSKNSALNIDLVNSIKDQESASGFSTPPTASADTCDSGFTEFFSKKAGTSSQQTSRASENKSEAPPPRSKRGAYSTSDSESDSRKTEDAMQCLEDDSYDGTESEETDFQTKEKIEFNRMNYRWIDWCNRQIVCGVNPRTILRKIFPNEDLIFTSEMSDRELWTRIVHFVSQPPARTRLYDINSMDHVVRLLTTCKNIIVLTGAGVSVSCGIPDFRSRSGIYARLRNEIPEINDPHEIFDIRFFSRDPRPFFKFAKELYPGSFTPSLCHRFIRLLERKEKLLRNFSQNIDTLERLAGIERVVECHGSFATASCTKCGVVVTAEEIREDVLAKRIPMCAICNPVSNSESSTENQAKRISCCTSMTEGYEDLYEKGILKPDIVFFGESLPESFHPAINADRQLCDCLLVIGSSLKVRPVSLIPEFLKADVPQILINRERVGNYIFDVELLGDADIIVNQICRMIGGDWTEICEQPELSLSATLEFNPETTETVNLPLTRTVPVAKNKCESNSKYTSSNSPSSCQSPTKTTEDTQDVKASPTELSDKSPNESLKCRESSSTTEPAALTGETINVDDTKLKKAFVFSVENVPKHCYYFTPPNRYIFPGSTHTWNGSGDPVRDSVELFEDEEDNEFMINYDDDDDDDNDNDDDDDDDEDDDDDDDNVDNEDRDEDKFETESPTNLGEHTDSDDVADHNPKSSHPVQLNKRKTSDETLDDVLPLKQQKTNDD